MKHQTHKEYKAQKQQLNLETNELRRQMESDLARGKARAAAELDDAHRKIRDEVESLEDARKDMLERPRTLPELADFCKQKLREGRQQCIEKMVFGHMQAVQKNRSEPFQPESIRVHLLPEYEMWRLFFLAVSEDDIDRAIARLQESKSSATQAEIDAKVEEINARITELAQEASRL